MITGKEIKRYVDEGKIVITPFTENQLNPNSYNVVLHNTLKVYKNNIIDMREANEVEELTIPEEGLLLEPGKLYLGRTVEYTETPQLEDEDFDLVIAIDGRSSTARAGLSCHISAGFGDIGFKGTLTCEIHCVQPVRIYPNTQIGQLYYTRAYGEKGIVYNGRYQNQIDATETRMYKGDK